MVCFGSKELAQYDDPISLICWSEKAGKKRATCRCAKFVIGKKALIVPALK